MTESDHTRRAKVALRIVLKRSLVHIDMKQASMIQEAIDMLVECKIVDAIGALADSIQDKTGVRP